MDSHTAHRLVAALVDDMANDTAPLADSDTARYWSVANTARDGAALVDEHSALADKDAGPALVQANDLAALLVAVDKATDSVTRMTARDAVALEDYAAAQLFACPARAAFADVDWRQRSAVGDAEAVDWGRSPLADFAMTALADWAKAHLSGAATSFAAARRH